MAAVCGASTLIFFARKALRETSHVQFDDPAFAEPDAVLMPRFFFMISTLQNLLEEAVQARGCSVAMFFIGISGWFH